MTQGQNIAPLVQHLNERYDGRPEALAAHLEKAIYMLFFLEEETFSKKEIQNVVYALRSLSESLAMIDSPQAKIEMINL